jgi:hypothetical protein
VPYLVAAVVGDLRELEHVGLVADEFLLLVVVELDLMLFDELLEEGEGEGGEFLAEDVVLGGDFERGQDALDEVLLVVEGDEGLVDLAAAAVGRTLG